MPELEPPFDPATVVAWQQLADQTREAFDVWRHVSDPATPEAQGLALQLRRLLAETVDKKVAEWAFTGIPPGCPVVHGGEEWRPAPPGSVGALRHNGYDDPLPALPHTRTGRLAARTLWSCPVRVEPRCGTTWILPS